MGEFVIYSVKVSMCLVMFYVFYKLLLSRTTLHTFNRFMILSLVGVSLFLPFVHVTISKPVVYGTLTVDQLLMMAMVVEREQPEFHLTAISLIVAVYLIGVVGFFISMLISYFGIHCIMKKAGKVVDESGVKIFVIDDDIAPFSWFGNIVISADDYSNNRNAIITHEKAHVQKWHSADIMLCNLLTVVQWFNPAAWLMKAELQNVHEFEADEAVLRSGINAMDYQLLLVRKAVGDRLFGIVNNLNKDSLKKRIAMMKTKKTNRWASMKALVVLPLAAVAVVAFATPKMAEVENKVVTESQQLAQAVGRQVSAQMAAIETSAKSVEKPVATKTEEEGDARTAPVAQDEKVFDVVEVLPQFPGGVEKLMEYLRDNIKYPKEMMENNVQGRVLVQFVVTKTGDIADAKILKSVHPQLDAEAMRVVKAMPKWTPGKQHGESVNVRFTLPFSFSLGKGDRNNVPATDEKVDGALLDNITVVGYGPSKKISFQSGPSPLVVVDGKEMPDIKSLEKIDPKGIESITVLKNSEALRQYGEKGKNGVIVVKMKSK